MSDFHHTTIEWLLPNVIEGSQSEKLIRLRALIDRELMLRCLNPNYRRNVENKHHNIGKEQSR